MFEIAKHSFDLPESFVKTYRNKQPDWNGLAYFTFKRTYAREVEGENRTEEYWEMCRRVVEGTFSIQKNHCLRHHLDWDERKAQRTAKRMFELMWTFRFLPPGRGLWSMGTRHVEEKGSIALNNCFVGDTKILTDIGVVKLVDIVGQSVRILDGNCQWTEAAVNSFGLSPTQEITFRPFGLRSNMRITHVATPDHRWIVENGETTNIQVGDKVRTLAITHLNTQAGYANGVIHGLIFGDGTRHTYYPNRFMIRLCDKKTQAFQEVLEGHVGYVSTTTVGGDPFVTLVDDQQNLKDLPVSRSPGYIKGFIDGWLSADSSQTPAGSFVLATIRRDAADWLVDHAPFAGYVVTGWSVDNNETNFGERSAPLNKLTLSSNTNQLWVVESITPRNNLEEVFCPSVRTTESFTLAHGIHTGNCAFRSTGRIDTEFAEPFCFLMDCSMLGAGVGFDTRGAGKLFVKNPPGTLEYQIPDTREGWVESLRLLLNAYLKGESLPVFDYSKVRPAGLPIRGFGGISSGPDPLRKLHEALNELFLSKIGTTLSSVDIVDINNMIGRCVVAGNVRRSAELALGLADDKEFCLMKQDKDKLLSHRWASNNSIIGELGMDYSWHARQMAVNGEPGIIYLSNAQAYGRMKDPADWKDKNVLGFNPCSEQSLEDGELCTLVESFPAKHDTLEEFLETLKIAYLYAKTVTLVPTHIPATNTIMTRNRRIGLSQSGIIRAFGKHGRRKMLEWCDQGYEFIRGLDTQYSNWLGIPRSIKVTTVKPSGTISLLACEPPGIHYPHSRYYIRRVRVSLHSDLWKIAEKAGYKVEPAVGQEDSTVVIEFPIFEDNFKKGKADVSIWEQIANAVAYQKYWSDNAVSITVTVKQEEKKDIQHVLEFYEDSLKTVSFLPLEDHGYVQAPYETITKAQYEEMIEKITPISFASVGEAGEAPRYCDGDTCTI